MSHEWWLYFAWVIAAGLLGLFISAFFADWLQLARNLFLVPYVTLTGLFLYAFLAWSRTDPLVLLRQNWAWGALTGIVVSVFLIRNVRSGPASRQSSGADLAFDLTWSGLTYGLIDGLFLNVMPILATWEGLYQIGWTSSWQGSIVAGLLGLAASLLVTAAYHIGYPEFRDETVALVLVGNGLISLAYLISANPLGGIVSHVAMHVAAVLQGPETTLQLPPHYQREGV